MSLDGQQILVVDDEEAVRRIAARMLTQLGYTATEAADGTVALATLRQHAGQHALVLLDLTVPGIDELLAGIEQDDIHVPIVVYSGYDTQALGQRFADRPVAGYLQKPFRLESLRNAVLAALASA
jgi:CheY-like chemotaxis protein